MDLIIFLSTAVLMGGVCCGRIVPYVERRSFVKDLQNMNTRCSEIHFVNDTYFDEIKKGLAEQKSERDEDRYKFDAAS